MTAARVEQGGLGSVNEARLLPSFLDAARMGTESCDAPPEEEEMLDANFDHAGILLFVACMVALLILATLTSKNPPPRRERELLTTFRSKWLAPAPDDVGRLEAARGARNRVAQELLARCTREFNSESVP